MIQLIPFAQKDYGKLIAWVDSEEMLMQFAGPLFHFPLTTHQLDIYRSDKRRFAYKVINHPSLEGIGHAEIYLSKKEVATLCRILIGHSSLRAQGYGLQVVNQLLAICFSQLNVETASLNVFDWNTPAIRCYQKAGFSVAENNTKKREVNGKIWTTLNMIISKSHWEERQKQIVHSTTSNNF